MLRLAAHGFVVTGGRLLRLPQRTEDDTELIMRVRQVRLRGYGPAQDRSGLVEFPRVSEHRPETKQPTTLSRLKAHSSLERGIGVFAMSQALLGLAQVEPGVSDLAVSLKDLPAKLLSLLVIAAL